uniref:DUF262 domain-containing protein n=1 Tax=Dictyoglomus turgidum TaxID=513050 RepID=A0A7C3SN60_9BACT
MNVRQILDKVCNGEIVLPDFQRSFIWEPEDVRELVVSILGDYFIGSMLTMDSVRDESPFALRLIEGVEKINKEAEIQSLVKILLDGQQRTTALFYALHEIDIPLKGRKSPYRFFIDLEQALNDKWDDAVIAVSIKDKRKLGEIKNNPNIIPLSLFKNIVELSKKFRDHPRYGNIIDIANNFLNREIHIVNLSSYTDSNKIVETFERINRTGEPLSIFELLTARLYKYEVKLRDILNDSKNQYSFIEDIHPEFILKVIALIRKKEPKRKNILELESENFENDWEIACKVLDYAYKRFLDIRNGYGILDFKKWAPYSTMIVPLAAMIHYIKNKNKNVENKSNYDKIDKWYWASVFSNRYDQSVDTTSFNDLKAMEEWIEQNIEPEFTQKFNPNEIDFDIDKQNSAIYRGVINLIVRKGAYDFKTGQPPQFEKNKVQDDHIFPQSIFNEDRILNRTLISTNQSKIDKRPSRYFKERVEELGEERIIEILQSHLIPPGALEYLLKDDLNKFMELRKNAIVNEIRDIINDIKI